MHVGYPSGELFVKYAHAATLLRDRGVNDPPKNVLLWSPWIPCEAVKVPCNTTDFNVAE